MALRSSGGLARSTSRSITRPSNTSLPKPTPSSIALNQKLRDGVAKLVFDEKTGYLKSVLDLLDIPVESQVLVYTQTSLQAQHIKMNNPRAIYFNDNVSVGYIRGAGLIEVIAQDATMGAVFYVVHQEPAAAPTFGREQQCLRCHVSWDTLGVPGRTVLSTFPRKDENDYANGFTVDHYRPIEERWGGWYVTGKTRAREAHGQPAAVHARTRPARRRRRELSVEGQFDTAGYLTPYSDVVALMVIDHQAHFVQPVYASHVGSARRGCIARGRGRRHARRLHVVRGRGADHRRPVRRLIRLRREVHRRRSARCEGPLAPRARSQDAAAEVSAQLHDLLAGVQGAAARSEELGDGEDQSRAGGRETDKKFAHLTPAMREAIAEILKATT